MTTKNVVESVALVAERGASNVIRLYWSFMLCLSSVRLGTKFTYLFR